MAVFESKKGFECVVVMHVCKNGHRIIDSSESSLDYDVERCSKCGAKTISKCPSCNENIKGRRYYPRATRSHSDPVPDYCHKCGKPYPWKSKNMGGETEEEKVNYRDSINLICERFHKIVGQLRKRHDGRETIEIKDEYDVQDLMHALLKLFFDDIRAEEWTPSYAGKSSRMDFLLKNEEIVVEVKKTRKKLEAKEIGDQLIIDIGRYRQHQNCKTLICFVYDPEGRIENPAILEKDLSREANGLKVVVLVRPKA